MSPKEAFDWLLKNHKDFNVLIAITQSNDGQIITAIDLRKDYFYFCEKDYDDWKELLGQKSVPDHET